MVGAYITTHNDPTATTGTWAKLAEAESHTLQQFPQQSRAEIVLGLWRQERSPYCDCIASKRPWTRCEGAAT